MVDKCQLCTNGDAVWLVLDSKEHYYHEVKLTQRLKLDLTTTKQQDAYLACQSCRRQVEKHNNRSKRRRQLKFLKWKGEDGQPDSAS